MTTGSRPGVLVLAMISYEAYGQAQRWRGAAGVPMPRWDDLDSDQIVHWTAVAIAVRDALTPARVSGYGRVSA